MNDESDAVYHGADGALDHTARVARMDNRAQHQSVNKANFKKQRQAPSATEHREFRGRCHFPGQDGWEEVADFALSWTTEHSKSQVSSPA